MSEAIVDSSGNVFVDLGYSAEEAAILQMRADLMADLRKFIKGKKLTQAKAAEILGVSQSRVSDLTRGKWERFSLEMLITLATRAGMHVIVKTAASRMGNKPPRRMSRSRRPGAAAVRR
jgi:predicted XRE-type DNA-binding protein